MIVLVNLAIAVRLLAADVITMRFDVFAEVVTAHEPFVADGTREPLLSGVRAQVSLELVGSREPFAAEEPITDERSLTCMPAQVRLQVRRLVVHLPAAGNVTAVQVPPAQGLARRPEPVGLGAVRTIAGRASGISVSVSGRSSC